VECSCGVKVWSLGMGERNCGVKRKGERLVSEWNCEVKRWSVAVE
jgi:hypothetical protein